MIGPIGFARVGARPAASVEMRASRFRSIANAPDQPLLQASLAAFDRAMRLGVVKNPTLLTVIDYARPSTEPRLWVLDLEEGRVLYRELVAHGRGSGDNYATSFSNVAESHKTSLGLFVTEASYVGRNGYSLRLHGLDPGVNDNAYARAIVIHGASYVSAAIVKQMGRLGRSWGCPAVAYAIARPLIDAIKGGSVVYASGADRR